MKSVLRVLARGLLWIGATLVALAVVGLGYRAYRQDEGAEAIAIRTASGIDDEQFVRIGGIEQWVSIRGQDRANPVLLYVDGGPGGATSPFNIFSNWEKVFTIVQWDQRGAGKTRSRSGPLPPGVTIRRMADDGIEVAEFALRRLHKQKLVLVGASWGSALGVLMARSRPDLLYAYVGTGQVGDVEKAEVVGYRRVLAEAQLRHDQKAIKALRGIGPPPYRDIQQWFTERTWANFDESGAGGNAAFIEALLFAPHYTLHDVYSWIKGQLEENTYFNGADMKGPWMTLNLLTTDTNFSLPIFVIQGADDDIKPVTVAREYYDAITAPLKEFIVIPNAGHSVSVTRSDEFLKLLTARVRPLAIEH